MTFLTSTLTRRGFGVGAQHQVQRPVLALTLNLYRHLVIRLPVPEGPLQVQAIGNDEIVYLQHNISLPRTSICGGRILEHVRDDDGLARFVFFMNFALIGQSVLNAGDLDSAEQSTQNNIYGVRIHGKCNVLCIFACRNVDADDFRDSS